MAEAAICVLVSRGLDASYILAVRGAGDGPRSNFFALPGGTVEAGETPAKAMAREMFEETGLHVDAAVHVGTVRSPEDGQTLVHVFLATQYHYPKYDPQKPPAGPPNDEIAETNWMRKADLLAQGDVFRPTLELLDAAGILDGKRGTVTAMGDRIVSMDLGVGDVHVAGATRVPVVGYSQAAADGNLWSRLYDKYVADDDAKRLRGARAIAASISAAKRRSIPESQFAWPEKKKYPVDTKKRTKAAASYLVKEHNAGLVPDSVFSKARAIIRRAAKKFGIETELADVIGSSSLRRAVGNNAAAEPGNVEVHARLGKGGRMLVRHMRDGGPELLVEMLDDGGFLCRDVRRLKADALSVDPLLAGVQLMGPPTWADGTPVKLVWLQLAETGHWLGHPSGEFEMTPETFAQIVTNFKNRGLPVPFDMGHASEQPPTEGSLPEKGAPAQGWVHMLDNRGDAGLWGLTEWFDYAREGIQAGRFAFLSPAMRFGSKDPVTGKPIGARLTSVAITNAPFLAALPRLVAARDRAAA